MATTAVPTKTATPPPAGAPDKHTPLSVQVAEMERRLADLQAHVTHLEYEKVRLLARNHDLEAENLRLRSGGAPHLKADAASNGAGDHRDGGGQDVRKSFIVVRGYEPREKGEIVLKVGEVVFVNTRFDDGWGHGFNTTSGQLGYVPLAYLKEDSHSSSHSAPAPGTSGRPTVPGIVPAVTGAGPSQVSGIKPSGSSAPGLTPASVPGEADPAPHPRTTSLGKDGGPEGHRQSWTAFRYE